MQNEFSGPTSHTTSPTQGGAGWSTLSSTKSFSTINNLKTFVLLAAMSALLVGVGSQFGRGGLYFALGFTVLLNFFSYWFSDKIALKMSHAKEVSQSDAPHLHSMIEGLASRGGLPKPRVYIIPEAAPNAFATGRDPKHAAVAVTEGILKMLSREQLEGVVAHELAHVKHRDILISSVAAVLAGALTHFAYMLQWGMMFGFGGSSDDDGPAGLVGLLATIILAPIAAAMIQMAISRSREFEADRLGAQLCGNPLWLAGALEAMEQSVGHVQPMRTDPATAHMYIVNPLRGVRGVNFSKLFSTHPPTAERIARLQTMAREGGFSS